MELDELLDPFLLLFDLVLPKLLKLAMRLRLIPFLGSRQCFRHYRRSFVTPDHVSLLNLQKLVFSLSLLFLLLFFPFFTVHLVR